jgi:hypothetical protein
VYLNEVEEYRYPESANEIECLSGDGGEEPDRQHEQQAAASAHAADAADLERRRPARPPPSLC